MNLKNSLQALKARFFTKLPGAIVGTPDPSHYTDPQTQKRLSILQRRFQGALRFLNKITVSRHGIRVRLNILPWYLLIGPVNAGKTSLLANSGVKFILHRQFHHQDIEHLRTSENCDWWVTRNTSIVDVPGNYLSTQDPYPSLWDFFLRLIKQQRGKQGIASIIIALPLPEIIQQQDPSAYQAHLRDLFQRIHELQALFPQPIPCQLIITKCDLLPGFIEFFGESSTEDINQPWGIALSTKDDDKQMIDLFTQRFSILIKKLNQQLLWRLHNERNPHARAYIKDFPLQIEHLSTHILDFLNQFSAEHCNLTMQSIHLTSAHQQNHHSAATDAAHAPAIIPINQATSSEMQVFKETSQPSRSYFVKQLITRGLVNAPIKLRSIMRTYSLIPYTACATAIGIILCSTFLLGQDFNHSFQQAKNIQTDLNDYQLAIAQIQDPEEQLTRTLNLLDTLQQQTVHKGYKCFFSFYSDKSEQYANALYQHSLHAVLTPEIKSYFANYLTSPVNKNADTVYMVLKAYLMLGDAAHFQPDYILNTLLSILPKPLADNLTDSLITHLAVACHGTWAPLELNPDLINATRHYLSSISGTELAYIILKNHPSNSVETDINLGTSKDANAVFVSPQVTNKIASMFTAKTFAIIVAEETVAAAQETMLGNWVLGNALSSHDNMPSEEVANTLIDKLRTMYVSNYIDVWESLLANIHVATPQDLAQTDAMITALISNDSPLLKLLQTLHDNTYFNPVASYSPKLQSLGLLAEKSAPEKQLLYEIFVSLNNLHQYLHTVLTASDEKRAAFITVSSRMINRSTPDPITQIRLVAAKSPEPLKSWLDHLANSTWRLLMHDAGHYIDTSWQEKVIRVYQTDIADRYPFSHNAQQEVDLDKFVNFFGKPGIALNFYTSYLQPLIDTSTPEWRWKKIDDTELPFSTAALHQIQQIMHIHQAFFPNGDDKLYVQFALQPYQFGKLVKRVKLSIDDKQLVDESGGIRNAYTLTWPTKNVSKPTSVQLTMNNASTVGRDFPGAWGWFRLVNQSFESMLSKKEIMLNVSLNEHAAKYLLFTQGQHNPFMALNLEHFQLPSQLVQQQNQA